MAAIPLASTSRKYSLRSMPADHAVPSPVRTRTPTSSLNSSSSSTSSMRRFNGGLMQLRFSGRLNFTQAIRSSTLNETVFSSARVLVMIPSFAITSDWKMARLGFDRDPAKLSECIDAGFAAKTAVSGAFDSAERHLRLVVNGRAVDMAHAGLDLLGNPQTARCVLCEHGSGQAILGVIRQFDRVLLVARANDGDHRSKAFVAEQSHRGGHLIDHGGRHENAGGHSTTDLRGSILNRIRYQPLHMFDRFEIDYRAKRGFPLPRIAGRHGCNLGLELLDKGICDAFHDDDSFRGHAYLALVHEGAKCSGF